MEKKLYAFNYSQDIIHLQTKYALFKRVANIVFSVSFDEGFDEALMKQALQKLVDRNDCLRMTFVKEGKTTKQYFDQTRSIGEIPSRKFDTVSQQNAFIRRFRRKMVNIYKGEALKVVFVTNPAGQQEVLVKISHFAADTYGIGVLVSDLSAIYKALRDGTPLPPEPGKFADVLQKDAEYRDNSEALQKDIEFFKDYYEKRHPEHPTYLGIHGDESDRWLKFKRKGKFWLTFLFVRCDTEGYRFVIPASVSDRVAAWCEQQGISMTSFFFYTCAIACSLKNDKMPYQLPLELMNCRATVADRKAAGTKVQSLSVYVTVDYKKTFNESAAAMFADQSELYRHTRLSYLEVEAMEHKLWNYPMTSQIINYCFSFIPMKMPEGMRLQVYSNGKGALVTYMAMIYDVDSHEIYVNYDIQTKMVTPAQLVEFQNLYIHVVETVLANPDKPLEQLF